MKEMRKTVSFAVVHMATAFLVTWALTGSVMVGGAVALVEPAVNTVVYFFHEKVWARRAHGRLASESNPALIA